MLEKFLYFPTLKQSLLNAKLSTTNSFIYIHILAMHMVRQWFSIKISEVSSMFTKLYKEHFLFHSCGGMCRFTYTNIWKIRGFQEILVTNV